MSPRSMSLIWISRLKKLNDDGLHLGQGANPGIDEGTAQVAARSEQAGEALIEFMLLGPKFDEALEPLAQLRQEAHGLPHGYNACEISRRVLAQLLLNLLVRLQRNRFAPGFPGLFLFAQGRINVAQMIVERRDRAPP